MIREGKLRGFQNSREASDASFFICGDWSQPDGIVEYKDADLLKHYSRIF